MVDETGNASVDDADIDDCLPPETLTNLTRYRELERSRTSMKDIKTPVEDPAPIKDKEDLYIS